MTADTIYALSSGSPPAAVAIVRISGPAADWALELLAGRLPEPRRASLAKLSWSGESLDQALVLRFPGPTSATGEHLVELHLHGGRAVVAAVLDALRQIPGLRAAEPGEFTRRAFENGRIDLLQAEGLADLLEAETQSQRRAAMALAGGELSRTVEKWQERLLGLSAELEATIDFSDEGEVAEGLPPQWPQRCEALTDELEAFLARPSSERLREGVRVVIAGPPNVGKSSLLNRLAGRQAAITSAVAGTTRDLVEAPTAIEGAPFLLIDTAGLRDSDDEIESIGVHRAREILDVADIVLWLGSPADCPDRSKALIVESKGDLRSSPLAPCADIRVSSETGEGFSRLIELLIERAQSLLPKSGEVAIAERQRRLIDETLSGIRLARQTRDPVLGAEGLRAARTALDRLTGRSGVEDMLDAMFQRFCLGK